MKKYVMKTPGGIFSSFIAVIFISACAVGQKGRTEPLDPNPWMNTTWKVNNVPFESEEDETYVFSTFDVSSYEGHWGYFITFDRNTFSSNYSAMCGNDCFTSVTGEFYFTEATKVHIKVLSIQRNGFCSKKSETLNRDYGFYDVAQVENGWKITKSK